MMPAVRSVLNSGSHPNQGSNPAQDLQVLSVSLARHGAYSVDFIDHCQLLFMIKVYDWIRRSKHNEHNGWEDRYHQQARQRHYRRSP